jgi:hypothetical protein
MDIESDLVAPTEFLINRRGTNSRVGLATQTDLRSVSNLAVSSQALLAPAQVSLRIGLYSVFGAIASALIKKGQGFPRQSVGQSHFAPVGQLTFLRRHHGA